MGVFLLDGLVSYYRCNETGGNRLDESVNGLDQIVTGSVGSSTGKIGLGVDGTGNTLNFLDRPTNPAFLFGDGPCTVSGWQNIQTGEDVQDQPIMSVFETVGNQRSWLLNWDNSDNRYKVVASGNGTAVTNLLWGSATALNTFLHAVFIHDPVANLIKLSMNNNPFVTAAHSTGLNASSTAKPSIGTYRGVSHVVGLSIIDEIGVWNRILNTEELVELQTAPLFSTFKSSSGMEESFITIKKLLLRS